MERQDPAIGVLFGLVAEADRAVQPAVEFRLIHRILITIIEAATRFT